MNDFAGNIVQQFIAISISIEGLFLCTKKDLNYGPQYACMIWPDVFELALYHSKS